MAFNLQVRFKNMTWLEIQEELKVEKEKEICLMEKTTMLQEFTEIKETLNNLVTNNIRGPDNERLDLLEFFLDTALHNHKKELNKQECKHTEIYLRALIVAQDKVRRD